MLKKTMKKKAVEEEDAGDWRKEMKQGLKNKAEGKTHKVQVGDNCFRVLPDKKDITPEGKLNPKGIRHSPRREFNTHRDVGPDTVWNLRCGLDKGQGGKCFICQVAIPKVEGTKPAYAEKMRPQGNFVVNASRFDDGAFGPAKPWFISSTGRNPLAVRVGNKIASTRKDYLDPVKGYNINVSRVGTGYKGTNATSYPEVEGDESPSKVPAEILIAMKSLDEVVPQYDENKQKHAFYGTSDEDESPKRRKPGSSKRRAEEEETEVEDEELVESEEDETEGEDESEESDEPEEEEEDETEGEEESEESDESEEEEEDETEGEEESEESDESEEDEDEGGEESEEESEEDEPEEEEPAPSPKKKTPPAKPTKKAPAPVKKVPAKKKK